MIKEDVAPLWIITHQFQTNWVDGMLLHMIYCKKIRSKGLLYGTLITKILYVVGVDSMGESVDPIHSKINHSILSVARGFIYFKENRGIN